MRPVLRGANPQPGDYEHYQHAFDGLAGRIGMYCSYCERHIPTQLAVEHIQPKKGPFAHPELEGRWGNFLLGCVNCNSTKGAKEVALANLLLPDRDNTAVAYEYAMDGEITIPTALPAPVRAMARRTLELVGLDRRPRDVADPNDLLVAKDRFQQRMQAWLTAKTCKQRRQSNPGDAVRDLIVDLALATGFFSIWMTVFADDLTIRKLLIREFRGTAADCFDLNTTALISPRPTNGLPHGSKI